MTAETPTAPGPRQTGRLRACLVGLIGITLGGAATTITRYAVLDALEPIDLAFLRGIVVLICFAPFTWFLRPPEVTRRDLLSIITVATILFVLVPILFNLGFLYTEAGRGSLIISTMPMATLVLGVLAGRERWSGRLALSCLLVSVGVAIAVAPTVDRAAEAGVGDALLGLVTLLGGVYALSAEGVFRRYSPSFVLGIGAAMGSVLLAVPAAIAGTFSRVPEISMRSWGLVLLLGGPGGAVQWAALGWAQARLSPTQAMLLFGAAPLTAMLAAAPLLGETAEWNLLVSLLVVVSGMVLAHRHP